jgi:hypothetical protein
VRMQDGRAISDGPAAPASGLQGDESQSPVHSEMVIS